jgi:hypothetical protein
MNDSIDCAVKLAMESNFMGQPALSAWENDAEQDIGVDWAVEADIGWIGSTEPNVYKFLLHSESPGLSKDVDLSLNCVGVGINNHLSRADRPESSSQASVLVGIRELVKMPQGMSFRVRTAVVRLQRPDLIKAMNDSDKWPFGARPSADSSVVAHFADIDRKLLSIQSRSADVHKLRDDVIECSSEVADYVSDDHADTAFIAERVRPDKQCAIPSLLVDLRNPKAIRATVTDGLGELYLKGFKVLRGPPKFQARIGEIQIQCHRIPSEREQ